jgi:ABC-type multidrug transport system ATPase subunit
MIRLDRFEKRYGKTQAVWPLDLEVAAGESFALLGPNGGGKTTIIRALVGLHRPTSGRIWIDGNDIVRAPERVRFLLSYLPQRVTVPGMLTGREIVAFFARLRGVANDRVDEMLEMFELGEDADRYAREFSGGMVQRLGLAVAFLKDVPLFVLDEPGLNLDPLGMERLRDHLRALKKKGTTILFSSHVLHRAAQLADRVAIVAEGRVVKLEDMSAFQSAVTREMTVRVILSHATDEMIDSARRAGAEVSSRNGKQVLFKAAPDRRLDVIRAIEKAGGTIEEFHTETPDWEAIIRQHFDTEESS